MSVISFSIFGILLCVFVPLSSSNPVSLISDARENAPFLVEKSDEHSRCDDTQVSKWSNEFHECFINRKYNDGGQNLDYIVDRIMEHAEACVEVSSQDCRPDFQGFLNILNRTITQMKDYAQMYLEEIYKGREKINDLDCVETVLDLKTYRKCFNNEFLDFFGPEEIFEKAVRDGISCTNRQNTGCSREAKTTLNRIVRILLGIEQPSEEITEEEIQPTKTPPYRWYDYIIQPLISAWKAIVNFFG